VWLNTCKGTEVQKLQFACCLIYVLSNHQEGLRERRSCEHFYFSCPLIGLSIAWPRPSPLQAFWAKLFERFNTYPGDILFMLGSKFWNHFSVFIPFNLHLHVEVLFKLRLECWQLCLVFAFLSSQCSVHLEKCYQRIRLRLKWSSSQNTFTMDICFLLLCCHLFILFWAPLNIEAYSQAVESGNNARSSQLEH